MSITNQKKLVPKKKKSDEDIFYPVPQEFNPVNTNKPPVNSEVMRRIVQDSIRVAYGLKQPRYLDKKQALATQDQIAMVMHLIESIQPMDAIEAALASQFAITYIKGMNEKSYDGEPQLDLELFEFGHQVLETLQKYRSKGAQQISVQYNINKGQIVNLKAAQTGNQEPLEGEIVQ